MPTEHPRGRQPALFDVESFFADLQFANPSISPDGTRIAYLAPHRDGATCGCAASTRTTTTPSPSPTTPAAGSPPTTGPTTPAGCSTCRTPTATRTGTSTASTSTIPTHPPSTSPQLGPGSRVFAVDPETTVPGTVIAWMNPRPLYIDVFRIDVATGETHPARRADRPDRVLPPRPDRPTGLVPVQGHRRHPRDLRCRPRHRRAAAAAPRSAARSTRWACSCSRSPTAAAPCSVTTRTPTTCGWSASTARRASGPSSPPWTGTASTPSARAADTLPPTVFTSRRTGEVLAARFTGDRPSSCRSTPGSPTVQTALEKLSDGVLGGCLRSDRAALDRHVRPRPRPGGDLALRPRHRRGPPAVRRTTRTSTRPTSPHDPGRVPGPRRPAAARLPDPARRRRAGEPAAGAAGARRTMDARHLGLQPGRAVPGQPRLRRAPGQLPRLHRLRPPPPHRRDRRVRRDDARRPDRRRRLGDRAGATPTRTASASSAAPTADTPRSSASPSPPTGSPPPSTTSASPTWPTSCATLPPFVRANMTNTWIAYVGDPDDPEQQADMRAPLPDHHGRPDPHPAAGRPGRQRRPRRPGRVRQHRRLAARARGAGRVPRRRRRGPRLREPGEPDHGSTARSNGTSPSTSAAATPKPWPSSSATCSGRPGGSSSPRHHSTGPTGPG